ncbi:MAG TPA: glycosyltransferase family 25 protein [Steroidobacteraceae bacterium]|nr:glycosyltransferase family 25 protein [Steroidobacteraceae bacterium]
MAREPKTKIWVISVPTAEARRSDFVRCAGGAEWEFYAAHTGLDANLVYDEASTVGRFGRKLHPGELGCYSSHFSLWRWLLHSQFDQAIVLEDDVVADWKFLDELRQIDLTQRGIDYLRLFAKMPAPWRPIASPYLDQYRHLIRFTGYALGTQAYVVTRAGAERLIRHGASVEAPVDVYMDRTWDHGLLNLALYPFPVYERHQPSSIGESRFGADRHNVSTLLRKLEIRNLCARARRRLLLNWSMYGTSPSSEKALRQRLRRV